MRRTAIAVLLALAAVSARARDATDARVDALMANAHDLWSVTPPHVTRRGCDAQDASADEIVVCARDGARDQRVPSSAESDPDSNAARHALANGVPRAPRLSSLPDCTVEHCTRFGRVPPPVYYIDVTKLPEPPPGSDADLIARGEKRGD